MSRKPSTKQRSATWAGRATTTPNSKTNEPASNPTNLRAPSFPRTLRKGWGTTSPDRHSPIGRKRNHEQENRQKPGGKRRHTRDRSRMERGVGSKAPKAGGVAAVAAPCRRPHSPQ